MAAEHRHIGLPKLQSRGSLSRSSHSAGSLQAAPWSLPLAFSPPKDSSYETLEHDWSALELSDAELESMANTYLNSYSSRPGTVGTELTSLGPESRPQTSGWLSPGGMIDLSFSSTSILDLSYGQPEETEEELVLKSRIKKSESRLRGFANSVEEYEAEKRQQEEKRREEERKAQEERRRLMEERERSAAKVRGLSVRTLNAVESQKEKSKKRQEVLRKELARRAEMEASVKDFTKQMLALEEEVNVYKDHVSSKFGELGAIISEFEAGEEERERQRRAEREAWDKMHNDPRQRWSRLERMRQIGSRVGGEVGKQIRDEETKARLSQSRERLGVYAANTQRLVHMDMNIALTAIKKGAKRTKTAAVLDERKVLSAVEAQMQVQQMLEGLLPIVDRKAREDCYDEDNLVQDFVTETLLPMAVNGIIETDFPVEESFEQSRGAALLRPYAQHYHNYGLRLLLEAERDCQRRECSLPDDVHAPHLPGLQSMYDVAIETRATATASTSMMQGVGLNHGVGLLADLQGEQLDSLFLLDRCTGPGFGACQQVFKVARDMTKGLRQIYTMAPVQTDSLDVLVELTTDRLAYRGLGLLAEASPSADAADGVLDGKYFDEDLMVEDVE